jgi:hypothetical protein
MDLFMMKRLFTFFILLISIHASAQEIRVKLGPDQIAVNQAFTITVTVENDRIKSYDNFPDIAGMTKRGTSSSSSTNIVNGQISSSQSIIQNYIPDQEGMARIPDFEMTINGKRVRVKGKTVKIGPAVKQRNYDPFGDPFGDVFSRRNEPTEYIEVKDNAFFALSLDKTEVYIGEGFNAQLAFYVPQNSRAPLQFHDTGKQLTEILKDIRPANCWEENFNIDNINGEVVQLNNKNYIKYKIYQATYFPLTLEAIEFPKVGLEMIKYKVAKNPTFFGRNRKQDFKTFYTRPKKVIVKDLPPHPLKNEVNVGNYWLSDKINRGELNTGESFNYIFEIKGEGNISAIDNPTVRNDKNFDFFDPNVRQEIRRSNNRVMGSKSFSYFGIPNEPGEFNLGNYFEWIFFNPYDEKYDTLEVDVPLTITGESKRNDYISSNDLGSFYDIIEFKDNDIRNINTDQTIKLFFNLFILLVLISTAYIIFKV